MKKFEGWRTEELQHIATLMAGRELEMPGLVMDCTWRGDLYNQVIREIRNRRVKEELFQMKLEGIEEE